MNTITLALLSVAPLFFLKTFLDYRAVVKSIRSVQNTAGLLFDIVAFI